MVANGPGLSTPGRGGCLGCLRVARPLRGADLNSFGILGRVRDSAHSEIATKFLAVRTPAVYSWNSRLNLLPLSVASSSACCPNSTELFESCSRSRRGTDCRARPHSVASVLQMMDGKQTDGQHDDVALLLNTWFSRYFVCSSNECLSSYQRCSSAC